MSLLDRCPPRLPCPIGSPSRRRPAFSLIELLVVMLIISLLIGLLIPAVNKVRDAARRTQSMNNLKQIQLATANYESAHRVYPPSWQGTAPNAAGEIDGWSVFALLLPYLEQDLVAEKIDFNQTYNAATVVTTADGRTTPLSGLRVPAYISPAEPRDEARVETTSTHYPINYAANCGVWFVWDPATGAGGEGAFYPNSRLTSGQFRDGLGTTLGFAEVKAWNPYYRNAAFTAAIDLAVPLEPADVAAKGGSFKANSGHTEWVDGRVHQIGFTATFKPNTRILTTVGGVEYDIDWTNQQEGKSATVPTYAAVTARSYFVGGVHASFMDGTVRFITERINLGVWRALATRAGKEILPVDENVPDLLVTTTP